MNFQRSKELQQKSHRLIPGGCHTYAKGDDQYPELAPGFIVRGQGCRVWDVDGNEFLEYGMGLRSVTLGHAHPEVIKAAYEQMLKGNNFNRPAYLEVECAERLLDLIKGADMAKFAKNGSDVTTAAIKLARAYTGRDKVAICANHAFFSTDDWFIGTTPMSAGIPEAVSSLTLKFEYNNVGSVEALFEKNPGQIACLMMEAATNIEPKNGFLSDTKKLCEKHGALFVLDEMLTGFRWHLGGAQEYYGVTPDLSTFGKAMANGFSASALVGRQELMDLGGLFHDRQRVFLLSTTHGAESHSLAAAMKTMEIYRQNQVIEHLWEAGSLLKEGIERVAEELGVSGFFEVVGLPCNLVYVTRDQEGLPSQAFRSLFLQETIRQGLLIPSLVVSFSHTDEDIIETIDRVGEALCVYKKALDEGIDRYLVGRPVKPVFRTYN